MKSEELIWTDPGDAEDGDEGTLAGAGLEGEVVDEDFAAGSNLGRYVVLARMGAGGMGVVYAAYDPELDRRIALKLMHQPGGRSGDEVAKASRRLLAEAKAMAQLSHPNVITVHDVGTLDDRVFIAMEFVEGVPLSEWMREPDRSWQEILQVFLKAGRGLEAAHKVGLVHRDFKPDNVLVGADGRVRVLDFGLAHRVDGEGNERPRDREAGTPAYMSPEQHLGQPVDHRADQFSFCVAAYEALYGSMPFSARTRLELALAVTDGRIGPAPKGAGVPNWVRFALLRGLDPDPEGRWPDMHALLEALVHDPYHKWRRAGVWAVSGLLVLAFGFAIMKVAIQLDKKPGEGGPVVNELVCTSGADELAEFWNEDRAGTVRRAFEATGKPWAKAGADDFIGAAKGWAGDWAAAHRKACEDTSVHKTHSASMLDRRMACLDSRLAEFDELVGVMAGAEVDVLVRWREATEQLPDLEACSPRVLAQLRDVPSSDERAAHAAVERQLYRAQSLDLAGDWSSALDTAEAAAERARGLDDLGYLVRALLLQAEILLTVERPADATVVLEEAALEADRAGDDELRARALVLQARAVAKSREPEEAEAYVRRAEAVLERVGASELRLAELADAAAIAELAAERPKRAEARLREAIANLEALERPPVQLAQLRDTLGSVLLDLDRPDDAYAEHSAALEQWREHFGDQHPAVARAYLSRARVEEQRGARADALADYERALTIYEQAFGAKGLELGRTLDAMARTLVGLDEHERALEALDQAQAIFEAQDADVELASSLDAEGELRLSLGDPATALALHREALRKLERALGPREPQLGVPLIHVGRALLALERSAEARAPLELAVELSDLGDGDRRLRAQAAAARFALAKAWATGEDGDLAKARALARRARDDYVFLGRDGDVSSVADWLDGL